MMSCGGRNEGREKPIVNKTKRTQRYRSDYGIHFHPYNPSLVFATKTCHVASFQQMLHFEEPIANTGESCFEKCSGLSHIEGLVFWDGNAEVLG